MQGIFIKLYMTLLIEAQVFENNFFKLFSQNLKFKYFTNSNRIKR